MTFRCPDCGLVGDVDEDQWFGRVSIQCPECEYHETRNIDAEVRAPEPQREPR